MRFDPVLEGSLSELSGAGIIGVARLLILTGVAAPVLQYHSTAVLQSGGTGFQFITDRLRERLRPYPGDGQLPEEGVVFTECPKDFVARACFAHQSLQTQ
jgi:hypothetical protein